MPRISRQHEQRRRTLTADRAPLYIAPPYLAPASQPRRLGVRHQAATDPAADRPAAHRTVAQPGQPADLEARLPATAAAPRGCGPRAAPPGTMRATIAARRRVLRRRLGSMRRNAPAPSSSVHARPQLRPAPPRVGVPRTRTRYSRSISRGRMHQPVRQRTVGGEQQQAGGVDVQPADHHPAPAVRQRAGARTRSAGPRGSERVVTSPIGL